MPRVTRRSVASKDESSPADSPKSTSHRKRGAKKDEPEAEDVAVGEPQGTPSKRGGRQAAKADESKSGRAAAKGRSTSRGGRGKKEEPESEEEVAADSDEEEEEKAAIANAQSKGKGKGGRGGKSSARGTKNTSRAGRSSKAAEEEDNMEAEESVDKEETDEETFVAVKGKGSRSRGKTSTVTPSPQGGRRGKGKAAAVEENEEEDKGEDVEESKEENTVETTSKGRQRHTQNKEVKPATPPSSSGRRGRGQKTEATTKPTPATGRSSRKAGGASSAEPEQQDEKSVEEPMETDEDAASSKPEAVKDVPPVTDVIIEDAVEPSPSKKRKLEDDEDEHTAKRLKTSQNEPEADELADFIVVSKDDVPGPESREVADSLPPLVAEKISLPTTPEDAGCEGPRFNPLMVIPGMPVIVPLTEAELAKQYTSNQIDKDETSSILVEVGSECASDITGLSSRGLDISDGISLDSVDQMPGEGALDPTSPTTTSVLGEVSQQLNVPALDQPVLVPNSPSNAATEDSQTAVVDSQLPSVPSERVIQASQCSASLAVQGVSAPVENASSNTTSLPTEAPSQNGTVEESTDSHLTTIPEKTAPEVYVPSSTTIDSRKFILNPSFPVEMMDPAFCFSVVSYNILADCHLRRSDYSYTEPQFLDQEYRHTLLLKELDYLDGDIVCLQEVNPAYYTQTLLPAMKSRGYDGHFIKRTKEYWDEGEATFAKTSKFDIISHQSLSLGELAFKEVDDSGLSEEVSQAAKKYLDRADVILLTELNCKKTGKVITVCNIHVVYDSKAPDVQCIQVACAIKQLVAKAGNDLNPHIVCGDFNSEVSSPSYQLAKDGYLSDDHIHKLQALQNLDNTDGSSRALINHMWRAFQHTSSNLKSTYELTQGKEPSITSFTRNTHTTLDYIFHSASSVDTVGVLEALDLQVVDATNGLPSINIPSDHLSLKAVFRLKD